MKRVDPLDNTRFLMKLLMVEDNQTILYYCYTTSPSIHLWHQIHNKTLEKNRWIPENILHHEAVINSRNIKMPTPDRCNLSMESWNITKETNLFFYDPNYSYTKEAKFPFPDSNARPNQSVLHGTCTCPNGESHVVGVISE